MVGTSAGGLEGIEKAGELKPDVVLLDTEISECDFIEALRSITQLLPETRIIILTHSEEDRALFSALRVGAKGYISKDIGVEDLVRAIEGVHGGEVIISAPMAARMLEEFTLLEERKEAVQGKHELGLSKRETEVLTLVAKGASNREIASVLFISENTAKVHLSRILEKLHVRNRQQAVVLARDQGAIPKVI